MKLSSASKLWVLMITAFIDMVGVLMVIPIMPFYAKELLHSPWVPAWMATRSGIVVGVLVSAFSIAQLITSPMWGRFSDRHGRRPALLVGLTGSAIAYIIFAFALDMGPFALAMLFLSRLVQGAGGGTVSVIQAYVADSTEPHERVGALGWVSVATNAGVTIGPVLGSLALAGWGKRGPGLLAASLCLVNIIFAWRFLKESRDMVDAATIDEKARPKLRHTVARVITHSNEPSSRLIWIYAIAMGAFQGVTSMLALYLASRFSVTEKTIGFFFAYTGIISVLTRSLILSGMVARFGEARLSRIGCTLLATGIAALAFIRPLADPEHVAAMLGGILPASAVAVLPFVPLALAVALLPLGTAFTFPCVTGLLTRVISNSERGLYMGVQQTFGGAARVIMPIVFGILFDWHLEAPFLLSASMVAFTIYLGLGMERYVVPAPPTAKPATA
jgi:MFS family permease